MTNEELVKMKAKIRQLIATGESEAKIGNEGAAALFAEKAQELMTKYKVAENEVQAQHPEIVYQPLIVSRTIVNPFLSLRKMENVVWAEYLADIISSGYYCRVRVDSYYRNTSNIRFYGIDFDVDIAIMMFEKLSAMAFESCKNEMEKVQKMVGKRGFDIKAKKHIVYPQTWMGDQKFIDSFMQGFGAKLAENYAASANVQSFDRIDAYISIDPDRNFHYHEVKFAPYYPDEDTVNIGRRYGNYTAKQKTDKLHKQTNVEISKTIDRTSDNRVGEVILVIDDSGSMSGYGDNSKLTGARDGAKDFAQDAVKKGFAVGMLKFGTEAHWLVDSKTELNGEFDRAIAELNAYSGGTDMFKGLTLAASKFNSRMRVKRVIVIVTDGAVNDPQKTIQYADLLKASGIEIMTIGTHDADEEFLKKIASGNKNLMVSDSEIRKALKGMANLLTA